MPLARDFTILGLERVNGRLGQPSTLCTSPLRTQCSGLALRLGHMRLCSYCVWA